ncbi:MAG: LuxR C-terminal-related transcriptional regulator [Solirubrobacteraceae bacterium]|jgi:DNA-binding NarL/FixJ family response regulator
MYCGTLRLVVADDHALLHPVFQRALESEGFEIAAFARRGTELLPLVHRHAPDAVLLELDISEFDGIAALRSLKKRFPGIPAIVVAASASPDDITAAFEAGARAYILKTVEIEHLAEIVRRAIVSGIDGVVGQPEESAPAGILTDRELAVLRLLARGMSNKDIATRLSLSEQTVKFHLANIYRKLGVKNRTGAVSAALDGGVMNVLE